MDETDDKKKRINNYGIDLAEQGYYFTAFISDKNDKILDTEIEFCFSFSSIEIMNYVERRGLRGVNALSADLWLICHEYFREHREDIISRINSSEDPIIIIDLSAELSRCE